jgi:hypothetical protein
MIMRVGRPLGLTIALLACTVLYGLYPLGEALLFLTAAVRTNEAISARVVLTLVLSVGFLLMLIPAWAGRPPQMRIILAITVLALMGINLAFVIGDLAGRQNALPDAASQFSQTVDYCSLLLQTLVPLYVIWYLNRYPSRAYYNRRRGPK